MKALSRCESLLRDLDAACAVTLQTTLAGVLNFLEEFGARNANIVVRARLAVRFGVGVELLSMFSNILSLSFCVLGRHQRRRFSLFTIGRVYSYCVHVRENCWAKLLSSKPCNSIWWPSVCLLLVLIPLKINCFW